MANATGNLHFKEGRVPQNKVKEILCIYILTYIYTYIYKSIQIQFYYHFNYFLSKIFSNMGKGHSSVYVWYLKA